MKTTLPNKELCINNISLYGVVIKKLILTNRGEGVYSKN